MADRIARRISVIKREHGVARAQELIDRLGIQTGTVDGNQVLARVKYWRDKPCTDKR